jgi:hypothetical protein
MEHLVHFRQNAIPELIERIYAGTEEVENWEASLGSLARMSPFDVAAMQIVAAGLLDGNNRESPRIDRMGDTVMEHMVHFVTIWFKDLNALSSGID